MVFAPVVAECGPGKDSEKGTLLVRGTLRAKLLSMNEVSLSVLPTHKQAIRRTTLDGPVDPVLVL